MAQGKLQSKRLLTKSFYDKNGKQYHQIVDGYFSKEKILLIDPYAIDIGDSEKLIRRTDWAVCYKKIAEYFSIANEHANKWTENFLSEDEWMSSRMKRLIMPVIEFEKLRNEIIPELKKVIEKNGYKSFYLMYSTEEVY